MKCGSHTSRNYWLVSAPFVRAGWITTPLLYVVSNYRIPKGLEVSNPGSYFVPCLWIIQVLSIIKCPPGVFIGVVRGNPFDYQW